MRNEVEVRTLCLPRLYLPRAGRGFHFIYGPSGRPKKATRWGRESRECRGEPQREGKKGNSLGS